MEFRVKSIKELQEADYNPRKISEGAFDKLKESLGKFGVCKPVIANENGILIAGHQRTKAMKVIGIKEVPTFIMKSKIAIHDEIRFNLMHNSIETENSRGFIKNANNLEYGFNTVNCNDIEIITCKNGNVLKEICRLLAKYGAFDSIIIDERGNIIHNNDYAIACKQLNISCLAYKMTNQKAKEFAEYMKIDYGTYNYEALGIKAYNQTYCQMNRNGRIHSSLYENYILPKINKNQRIIDFGAGKKEYATRLKNMGFQILAYEPHLKKPGTENLDIRQVVKDIAEVSKDINKNGLYDVVILDSVLNSITSLDFEHYVLTVCNSLCKDNGIFFTATRNLKFVTKDRDISADGNRYVQFLDKDKFCATFRKGVWTMQKFNDAQMLENLCKKYFDEVNVIDSLKSQLYAICQKPKKLELKTYKEALSIEFNMEYPGNYRHNKHERIVQAVLNEQNKRK